MNRKQRQEAAVSILKAHGWTDRSIDRFMEQQQGCADDQVEALEREAQAVARSA